MTEVLPQEKFKLRLKILEEGLKRASSNESAPKTPNSHRILGFVSNNAGPRKRSSSQPRGSVINSRSSPIHQPWLEKVNSLENHISREDVAKRSLWGSKTITGKENSELVGNTDMNVEISKDSNSAVQGEMESKEIGSEDAVSGFLYDRLQKEVINLRKTCQAKDDGLLSKDDEIKVIFCQIALSFLFSVKGISKPTKICLADSHEES